ncbi:DUF4157 domain-containing protein [Nostoc sp. FACHB-110]|nr:DUF4157 domain-containing protein [Nostoc sp. FACHB-110]
MKLTIGQPGDKYEQEADRLAADVVQQINAPETQQVQREAAPEEEEMRMKPISGNIQREAAPEEEEMRMKPISGNIQREAAPEEEEVLMKPMVQRLSGAGGMTATPDLEQSIQQARSSGQPLTESIKEPMEQAFGADFSGVKVHTDAQSDELNQSIQAKAFTTGKDIFFRQGEYQPGNRGGQELIAHELTHVVQQNDGVVQRQLPGKKKQMQSVTTTGKTALQRRVVVAKKKMINDFIELTSIDYAVKRAGGPVELLKDADFSSMSKKEELYIVSHGKPGKTGDYKAEQIVYFLFSGPKALRKRIKAIYFTSCNAGAGVTDDLTDSVVAKIKSALDIKGWSGIKVSGPRGPSIKTDALGDKITVIDSNKRDTAHQIQHILKNIHQPIDKTNTAITDFENRAGRPATIEEKALLASEATVDFYKQFIQAVEDPTQLLQDINSQISNGQLASTPDIESLKLILQTGGKLTLDKPMLKLVSKKPKTFKKGCFITTACVESKGLPDDCYELTTLRAFRDTYMRTVPYGESLISHYYEVAPKIVAHIQKQPHTQEILADLYERITEAVRLIEAGENQVALQYYCALVRELEEEYLQGLPNFVGD